MTTTPYTQASFIDNLDIFLASLPKGFHHGNKFDIEALPHHEDVKTQYRLWLKNKVQSC